MGTHAYFMIRPVIKSILVRWTVQVVNYERI